MAASAAAPPKLVSLLLLTIVTAIIVGTNNVITVGATWCVVRSSAAANLLQIELDYACGHGADCGPIQPGGSCFFPNTIQNHASYAFDSYYQRKGRAPGSCYFGGTATIAVTDPSYGPCRYPSSSSNAGRANTSISMPPTTNSNLSSPSSDMNDLPFTKSKRWMSRSVRKLHQTLPDAKTK